jgi:signal peptidase II
MKVKNFRLQPFLLPLMSVLALVGIDAFSKILALHRIPPLQGSIYPFGGIGIFDFFSMSFSLNLVSNTGAAWGVFPGHLIVLLLLRIAVVFGILFYLLFLRQSQRASLPFWLIVSGATGNIVDMCVYGRVIDFLHFRFFDWSFPIFNIADSCITIGVFLLIMHKKPKVDDAH